MASRTPVLDFFKKHGLIDDEPERCPDWGPRLRPAAFKRERWNPGLLNVDEWTDDWREHKMNSI